MTQFDDLPEETRNFLSGLRPDEVQTLNDGIRLVNAIRTVGTFFKWVIVGILGIAMGIVMFAETIGKIMGWVKS